MRAGYRSEFFEGREEFAVARGHGGSWEERPNGERIDQAVIERLVAHGIGDGHRSRSVALRFRQYYVPEVDAKALLRGPGDEALRVNGAAEVGVEVATLRHAMEKGAQGRAIVARRFEGGRGDDRVEFARHHRQAQQDDKGREEDDGKDDPTSQGLPRCARCSAKLAVGWAELNRGDEPQASAARVAGPSIAVLIRLIRAVDGHADIGRLLVRHFRQLGADLGEMEPRDLL